MSTLNHLRSEKFARAAYLIETKALYSAAVYLVSPLSSILVLEVTL